MSTSSPKRISLKSLSPARQRLIVCMHQLQFGAIKDLRIVDGDPQMLNATILRRRDFYKPTTVKPVSPNFILKAPQCQLIEALDEIQNGLLENLIFRDGLPCEMKEFVSPTNSC